MQQLFRLLIFFKAALHVSGDKFAHPREHFLTVCPAFGTMHRDCCRTVPQLRWNSWGWAKLSPETCRAELKRLINGKSCWILLAVYIFVLKLCSTVTQKSNCTKSFVFVHFDLTKNPLPKKLKFNFSLSKIAHHTKNYGACSVVQSVLTRGA
jgi:hypothetical protein